MEPYEFVLCSPRKVTRRGNGPEGFWKKTNNRTRAKMKTKTKIDLHTLHT